MAIHFNFAMTFKIPCYSNKCLAFYEILGWSERVKECIKG
jgi:hypothetical protein